MSFSIWLILLSIVCSKPIHVVANSKISFFSYGWVVFHCVYICHIFFIHSSIDWYLGSFYIWATMNTGVYVSFRISVFILFAYIPRVKLLGHMVVPFLVFWEPSVLFFTMAAPIYIPTNSVEGFPFLHILMNICCLIILLMTAILTDVSDNSLLF